jgi:heme-degrading monooxygenase HmoA
MIARTWRGATRAADAETYVTYLHATGLKAYRDTPGNRGAFCLRRIVGDRAEFVTLSLWESEAAIKAFAGEDTGSWSSAARTSITSRWSSRARRRSESDSQPPKIRRRIHRGAAAVAAAAYSYSRMTPARAPAATASARVDTPSL